MNKSLCFVIVTASLGLQNLAIADGFSFGAGMDFTQGKYGGATTTDIWYVPFTGRYSKGRASARLTIPYLDISGPGNILGPGLVDIIDGRIGLDGGDVTSIGTGDNGGGGVFICSENQLAVTTSNNSSFCLDNSTGSSSGNGGNSGSGRDDDNSGSGSGDDDDDNDNPDSDDDNDDSEDGDNNSGPGNSGDDSDSESDDDNSGPGNGDDVSDEERDDNNSGPGNSDDDPNSESDDDNSGPGNSDDVPDEERDDNNSGSGSIDVDDNSGLDSVDNNSGPGDDDLTVTSAQTHLKSHSDEEPIDVIPDASTEADAIDVDAISRRTASGLGDIVAALSYNLINHKPTGIAFDITGRVKFPTASTSQRLGSGEFDYAVQGDLFKSIAKFNIRTTFGYKFLGDPQGVTLQNVFYGGAGVGYRILPRATIGTSFNISQSALRLQDSRALSVYYSHRLGNHFRLNFYGLKGFSDRSPDWGSGLTLRYVF